MLSHMAQKKPQQGYAATRVNCAALMCLTRQAQNLAKTQEINCFISSEKKKSRLILLCKHLDSFSVSPSAKQRTQ